MQDLFRWNYSYILMLAWMKKVMSMTQYTLVWIYHNSFILKSCDVVILVWCQMTMSSLHALLNVNSPLKRKTSHHMRVISSSQFTKVIHIRWSIVWDIQCSKNSEEYKINVVCNWSMNEKRTTILCIRNDHDVTIVHSFGRRWRRLSCLWRNIVLNKAKSVHGLEHFQTCLTLITIWLILSSR